MKVNFDTAHDIENMAICIFRKEVSFFSKNDTLIYEKVHRNVKIVYYSKLLSDIQSDLTGIELYFCLDTGEIWIGALHVAVSFRSIGLGLQLVRAAEEVARSMDFRNINVFPLQSSRSFWLKMGYKPHRCTARVLHKSVNPHCHEQTLVLSDQ